MDFPRPKILEASGVHKAFARDVSQSRRRAASSLRAALFGIQSRQETEIEGQEFWAVNDVSLSLERGKALGIIGLNGSGKTTLLRMLAGQILPDRGHIRVTGSSAAMIDLTAGFQPSASGRQNIFMRTASLGFTNAQTLDMLDEIIEFSELGDAIEAPLQTYSSGMQMRLAFSIISMVAPDILFIDEVLAVGDFRFRQKCLGKVREMRARSSFVFVSHSMADVSRFCDEVIVMHKGRQVFVGDPDKAIAFYQELDAGSLAEAPPPKSIIPQVVDRPDMLRDFSFEWLDSNGLSSNEIMEGRPFGARVSFRLAYRPQNLVVGIPIYTVGGEVVAGFATDVEGVAIEAEEGELIEIDFKMADPILNPDKYRTAIGVTDGPEFLHMIELPELKVVPRGRKSWGRVSIPFEYSVSRIKNDTDQLVS